ncbi:hypothetical protein ALP56_04910 [Pseudomonas coronafaciens pv. oryzae]|nr:hypothetical protein ALP56_04910 [Pseudomonas coronafaciens pv. oryzae]
MEHHQDRLTALQLYFPGASRARVTSFWHHLSAPALAQHLLKVAQKAKIEQVMLKTISAGYLPGHRISHHHPELGDIPLGSTSTRLRYWKMASRKTIGRAGSY